MPRLLRLRGLLALGSLGILTACPPTQHEMHMQRMHRDLAQMRLSRIGRLRDERAKLVADETAGRCRDMLKTGLYEYQAQQLPVHPGEKLWSSCLQILEHQESRLQEVDRAEHEEGLALNQDEFNEQERQEQERRRRSAAIAAAFQDVNRNLQATSTSSSSSAPSAATARPKECNSDFECTYGEKCVKPNYSGTGSCMKAVNNYGLPQYDLPRLNSVGPKTPSRSDCSYDTQCPIGFKCDSKSGACVK
jgi:hypothetical protein